MIAPIPDNPFFACIKAFAYSPTEGNDAYLPWALSSNVYIDLWNTFPAGSSALTTSPTTGTFLKKFPTGCTIFYDTQSTPFLIPPIIVLPAYFSQSKNPIW